MIRPNAEPRPSATAQAQAAGAPVFLALSVSGPSPGRDRLESLRVGKLDGDGAFTVVEGSFEEGRRMLAPAGEGQVTAPIIVGERDHHGAWMEELGIAADRWFAVDELAAWIDPGGLGSDAESLAQAGRSTASRPAELEPRELRLALAHAVGRTLALPEMSLGALARAWELAAVTLAAADSDRAARLRAVARLVDQPSILGAPTSLDGRMRACGEQSPELEVAIGAAPLGHEHASAVPFPRESLPPGGEWVKPLSAEDVAALTEVLGSPSGAHEGGAVETAGLIARPAQVRVLDAVAGSLGADELLLLHAPTGTGKTLAYLLPALLFGLRNNVRVGVATYTRALQRQAFARDLPLALELLERTGVEELPRASVLKGRQNYVCGRSLALEAPAEGDGAATALAYAHLAAFAFGADDGDLDRLPPIERTPFGDDDEVILERRRLVAAVRGRTGCCTRAADRERCGVESARWRAERSHVVLTNQAFALARREFFNHLVFDECEHLHDQAESAFSHVVALPEVEQVLRELRGERARRGRRSRRRGPLERLVKTADAGSKPWTLGQELIDLQESALSLLGGLVKAAERFLTWRESELASRAERDSHSLLREYVEAAVDPALVALHGRLVSALARIDGGLSNIVEVLSELPGGGGRRLRGALERSRLELLELSTAVDAWIPLEDGEPAFRRDTFYDLEPGNRGGLSLVARVLLPNEYLGRVALPDLDSAVLLSATTWLGGGFDASKGYLGLDRAAEPAEFEDREPSAVTTFRAPEAFDYGRVLVAVPRDAPDYRAGKQAWLDFAARYIAHLALRTDGRTLVLLTNAADALDLGERLTAPLAARGLDCLVQGRRGQSNEQLAARFRSGGRAVLIGLDTFWFGADFPGDALEHVVIAKLPYGVPDRYHHAQCAVLGAGGQRKRIYMPRALARFRQGFGRLMRRATDRGCVHILDHRILEPRHRQFLRELPIDAIGATDKARLVRGDSEHCFAQVFEHVGLTEIIADRGLTAPFAETRLGSFSDASSAAAHEPFDRTGAGPADLPDFSPWAHTDGDAVADSAPDGESGSGPHAAPDADPRPGSTAEADAEADTVPDAEPAPQRRDEARPPRSPRRVRGPWPPTTDLPTDTPF